MAKLRRFAVASLEGAAVGSEFFLSPDESRHVRVLRLEPGTEIELFDASGISARARINANLKQGVQVALAAVGRAASLPAPVKLVLATAWPKGKRAAVLVEKCAELGVDEIVPVRFARSVVTKDDESEGVVRLRRIAAEASKQSERDDVMRIAAEMDFAEVLKARGPNTLMLLCDPDADEQIVHAVLNISESTTQITVLIGPEGGFTTEEIALADSLPVVKVRMAAHVLRVETAAVAACAICGVCLDA